MAVYPTALKVWAALVDHADSIMAAHHNTAYDEIAAIEAELGVLPKGAYADVAARLAALLSTVAHTTIGDGAPHHAAITLGGGSDPKLSVAVGQILTLAGDDPGHYAQARGRASGNWLARTNVPVAGDTITIGFDIFELDDITLDTTDDTVLTDFDAVTDPLDVVMEAATYPVLGVDAGTTPLVVGELVFLGAEYMRVLAIDPVTNTVTFGRARCGTAAAVHVAGVSIFGSVSRGVNLSANIKVGSQAGGAPVAPAVGTPLFVACINDDDAVGGVNNVTAQSLAAGAEILLIADSVGVVAHATTDVAANFAWDTATMVRGAVAGTRNSYAAAYTVLATEATDMIYVPLPFAPTQVYYSVLRAGVIVVWDGTITIVAAAPPVPDYILFTDGGAAPFVAGDILSILAIE